jgi:hypothetical protein
MSSLDLGYVPVARGLWAYERQDTAAGPNGSSFTSCVPAVPSVVMCTTELTGCGPISTEVPPDWDERAFRLASRTLEYLWFRIACQCWQPRHNKSFGTVQFGYHVCCCNRHEIIWHCCIEDQPGQGNYCRYSCSLHRVHDQLRDHCLGPFERAV